MGNYHYIVSALVDYSFDADTKTLDTESLCAELKGQLSSKDWTKLGELWWFFDLRNILDLRSGRSGVFSPLSNLTREDVEAVDTYYRSTETTDEQVQELPLLPKFVENILLSYKDATFASENNISTKGDVDNKIWEAYYKYANSSKSGFVRAWSEFDLNVRNISAAYTAREKGIALSEVFVGKGEITDIIMQNETVQDFGLKNEFNEVDNLIQLLTEKDILVKEKGLDKLRWKKIDELLEFDYFDLEVVLGYVVKLSLLERWRVLDDKEGLQVLNSVVGKLTSKENIKSI